MATILALVAALGRCCYLRPAFTHALWLLVLLKLVTPPMQPVAVHWFQEAKQAPPETRPIPPLQLGSLSNQAALAEETRDLPLFSTSSTLARITEEDWSDDWSLAHGTADQSLAPGYKAGPWVNAVAALWLAGSATWFTLACWRICRFQRVLRGARPAPHRL